MKRTLRFVFSLVCYSMALSTLHAQDLEDPPVDIAAGFFFQTFDVGDIVEANTSVFSLQISHTSNVLTLYGGPGIEPDHCISVRF